MVSPGPSFADDQHDLGLRDNAARAALHEIEAEMEREMQRVVALRHAAGRDQVIRRLQEELSRSREELSRAAVRVREATARVAGGSNPNLLLPEVVYPLPQPQPRDPNLSQSQPQHQHQHLRQHQYQPGAAGGRGAERARAYPDMAQSAVPKA